MTIVTRYLEMMLPKLSEELRTALSLQPEQPIRVEDPITHRQYVVVAADVFERMQSARPYDDSDITPEEMIAAASMALNDPTGWGAPGMEFYDEDDSDQTRKSP